MGRGVAGLGGQLAGVVNKPQVVRNQHAAAGGGDDFVAVEGKDAGFAEDPGRIAFVSRPQRFGRILNHRHAVLPAGGQNRFQVGALAIEVDDNDRFRQPARVGPRRQRFGQQVRVHVPAFPLAVYEGGPAAFIDNGVDAGAEGERGNEHFITRANAGQAEGQMERGRAGTEGQGVLGADGRAKFLLEGVNVGAERGDPVAGERFGNIGLLAPRHVGRRKVKAGLGHLS
jgi:hypothetical protein